LRSDGPVIAKSLAAATVVFLIPLAQRHSNSSLAGAVATVPRGTIAGLVAFASADPSGAQTFTRSAVLALPGAGLLVWCGAALLYLHLTR
jgi:hypothetical protein